MKITRRKFLRTLAAVPVAALVPVVAKASFQSEPAMVPFTFCSDIKSSEDIGPIMTATEVCERRDERAAQFNAEFTRRYEAELTKLMRLKPRLRRL